MSETRAHKISAVHIARRVIQILFFILAPGLFATAFDAAGSIVRFLSGHYSGDIVVPVITLIVLFSVTALFGRFFCGFVCSFGAMQDFFGFLSRKAMPGKKRMPEKADGILKLVKYLILVFIVTAVWITAAVSIPATSNPWTIFGMFASIGDWASPAYLLTVGGALLMLIIIGSFFTERFFCRYFCPLGALLSVFSRMRVFNIVKKRDNCGSCRACTAKCSMGIPLYKDDVVRSGECINCFACTEICPRRNAHANPAPALASAVSVAAIAGVCYAGTILPAASVTQNIVYTQAASEETAAAVSSAKSVAGAVSADQNTAASGQSTTASGQSTAAAESGTYKDGTYTGSGTGFRGTTKVNVTVSGGKITNVEIVSYQDNQQYFSRAKASVISEILSSQDVNVDAVSGATFSSHGIMEAVADALGVDYTNPNSTMQGGRMH